MSEILVIAIVAIVVVGPKDLPKLLRTVGKTISGVKRMAGDFQRQFNDAIEEADLGDIKNIATGKAYNPLDSIKEAVDDVKNDVNSGLNGSSNSLDGDDVEPLFPENETSKRLAKLDAKESTAKTTSKAKAGTVKSGKAKTGKAKTGKNTITKKAATKKTVATKAVKTKVPTKKTTPKSNVKKLVVKKTSQAKSKSTAT